MGCSPNRMDLVLPAFLLHPNLCRRIALSKSRQAANRRSRVCAGSSAGKEASQRCRIPLRVKMSANTTTCHLPCFQRLPRGAITFLPRKAQYSSHLHILDLEGKPLHRVITQDDGRVLIVSILMSLVGHLWSLLDLSWCTRTSLDHSHRICNSLGKHRNRRSHLWTEMTWLQKRK